MQRVYLGIGTNMGDRLENINQCLQKISANVGQIIKKSSIYETKPWGVENQENYLNLVVGIQTVLTPFQLLHEIQTIENKMGRKRGVRWASRPIDIDIISYENLVLNQNELTVPHPLASVRNFVLYPLSEIAGNWTHPVSHKNIQELIDECDDKHWIKKYTGHENSPCS